MTGPDGAFVRGALPRTSFRQRSPYTMGRGNMQGPGMGMMGNGMGGGLGFDAYGQLGMMAPGMPFPGMMSPLMGGIPGYPGGVPTGPPMPGGMNGMGMNGMGPMNGMGMMGSPPNGMMANGDGGLPAPLPQTPPPGSSMGGSMGSPVGGSGSLGKRVVVLNLPWQTTWQALKEFFTAAGTITRADVAVDETGRSR